jgi:hypothetical protein
LRVFEDRELRRIFGPKRDEVTGGWKIMRGLHKLQFSENIIRIIKSRMMRSAEHAKRIVKMRNTYKISVGKPKGKRPTRKT